jgi:SAM-dependent methyltransferase
MDSPNRDQLDYWNDRAGETWVKMQPLLDRQIGPLGLFAMDALGIAPGQHVLDIGCGCGDTTLELARRVGPRGAVLGVDLSLPMLEVALDRAAGVTQAGFRQADAQVATFNTKFDAAFSRFGVMFFADPVAAFRNIHAALQPGSRLGFVCWRRPDENPWMMVPLQAALPHLPPQAPSDPLAPGPFAFADKARVEAILRAAGFSRIEITPHDQAIGGLALADAVTLAVRVGPLGRALAEAPEQRDIVTGAVRHALESHMSQDKVWLASATWSVVAA